MTWLLFRRRSLRTAIVDDRNRVASGAVAWVIGVRIIQIIGVVLIDQCRSDIERVLDAIGIVNANRLVRGIVDDLEKVRVGWQRVDVVAVAGAAIFPMTVIVGISEAITEVKVSVYPHQAK